MHSPIRFIPSILTKRPPLHLTLFVTKRCNARCPFCFYSAGAGSDNELTIDEYNRISSSMGNLLWLALSGGEPLLRDDLTDIVRIFYKQNNPSIILLPTNGLMPERTRDVVGHILKQCPESVIAVKLSLDGNRELHDKLRGVTGAYEKMHESYELLRPLLSKHKNFELGINTVFCADNQDSMDAIIDHVLGLPDIRTHTISLARGDMRDSATGEVDLNKYLAASERLASGLREGCQPSYSFGGARIKAAQDVIQRRLIHRTATEGARQLECYAGRLNLVITESGELYPCESFLDEHRLGNLRENDFNTNRMLDSDQVRSVMDRISSKCFCTHECYMMTNILFSPAMYTSLVWEYMNIR